jgi:hypothetical protein
VGNGLVSGIADCRGFSGGTARLKDEEASFVERVAEYLQRAKCKVLCLIRDRRKRSPSKKGSASKVNLIHFASDSKQDPVTTLKLHGHWFQQSRLSILDLQYEQLSVRWSKHDIHESNFDLSPSRFPLPGQMKSDLSIN